MPRELVCQHCKNTFVSKGRDTKAKFCSMECSQKSRAGTGNLYGYKCDNCGVAFASSRRVARFCSRACRNSKILRKDTTNWTLHDFTCPQCQQPFKSRERDARYCSRACSNSANFRQRGKINTFGYRQIRVDGRYVMEHRHIVEQAIGRRLNDKEIVHHKDGNRLNNTTENLEIVASQAEHLKQHHSNFIKKGGFRDSISKQCPKCGEIKLRAEFHRETVQGRDPNKSYCKVCTNNFKRKTPKEGQNPQDNT